MKILQKLTKTISVSFVVWLLESTNLLVITVIKKPKNFFQDYCQHFEVNPQDFKGVELTDFPQLKKYFEVQLFAMFLKEDGTAKTLYLSRLSFPTKIYINVYKNHLSLITDIKMYSKQYI